MQLLVEEAQELPAAAVRRARSIAWVKPPDHLADYVPRVRREHGGALAQLHRAIDERLTDLGASSGDRGAFYAASELALIERAWRPELAPADRSALRACWTHLLAG